MKFNFENLVIWQESMSLCKTLYTITKSFPKDEIYGLTNQTRRAASSIPLNIAEGKGRSSKKEFIHFLHIAKGSLLELITCIELSEQLGYISKTNHQSLRKRTQILLRRLTSFIKAVGSEAQTVSTSVLTQSGTKSRKQQAP